MSDDDTRPSSPADIREAIDELRDRSSNRPDLVEEGRTDLLWIAEDDDGVRRMGDNVRADPDTEGETYIVTDPETGQEYWCNMTDAWTTRMSSQDPSEVM